LVVVSAEVLKKNREARRSSHTCHVGGRLPTAATIGYDYEVYVDLLVVIGY
jgi:hypothetical protein